MSLQESSSAYDPLKQLVCGQKIVYCKKNPVENPQEPFLELIVPCGQSVESSISELRKKGFYVAGKDF